MIEKINIVSNNLSDKEKTKLPKFYATLSLTSEEDLKNVLSFLDSNGIKVTKANELKLLTNNVDELRNKLNILESVGEKELAIKEPKRLNNNILDIIKRINYCKAHNVEYKDAEGKYMVFLFSTTKWKNEVESKGLDAATVQEIEPATKLEEQKTGPVVTPSVETEGKKATDEFDNYSKIREELEATRKALENEFDFTSFEDLGGPQR